MRFNIYECFLREYVILGVIKNLCMLLMLYLCIVLCVKDFNFRYYLFLIFKYI